MLVCRPSTARSLVSATFVLLDVVLLSCNLPITDNHMLTKWPFIDGGHLENFRGISNKSLQGVSDTIGFSKEEYKAMFLTPFTVAQA